MIYFILNAAAGVVKIGKSVDPAKRLAQLQTATPEELALIATIPGDLPEEARLHATYAHLRCRGEWFRATDELLDDIEEMKAGPSAEAPVLLGGREINSVYLAGRISKPHGDWRREIVPGWEVGGGVTQWNEKGRTGKYATGCTNDAFGDSSDVTVAVLPDGRSIAYRGPFWRDLYGGHGGGDGPHAFGGFRDHCGIIGVDDPIDVAGFCLKGIWGADLVFAWIDSRECLGTLVEIGYGVGLQNGLDAAGAKSTPAVVVAAPKWDRELWFACAIAHSFIEAPTAGDAWRSLWSIGLCRRLGPVGDVDHEESWPTDDGGEDDIFDVYVGHHERDEED